MERQIESRPRAWIVAPMGHPQYSEQVTHVDIEDDAGGEFVVVRQSTDEHGPQRVSFDPDEWPVLRQTIDKAMAICRDNLPGRAP